MITGGKSGDAQALFISYTHELFGTSGSGSGPSASC